jgi:hypothetical protein
VALLTRTAPLLLVASTVNGPLCDLLYWAVLCAAMINTRCPTRYMHERYWILVGIIISYCVLFTLGILPAAPRQGVELGRWRLFRKLIAPGMPGVLCALWLVRHRRLPTNSVPRIVVVRWLDRERVNSFDYSIIWKMVLRPLIDSYRCYDRVMIVIVPFGYRVLNVLSLVVQGPTGVTHRVSQGTS